MVDSHSKLGYCIHVLTLIEYYNIFQIALFVPFAVLAGLEGKHYGEVREEPVALRPPYSPYIWHGMINPLTTVCPWDFGLYFSLNIPFPYFILTWVHLVQVCIYLGWVLFTFIPHYQMRHKRLYWFIVIGVRSAVIGGLIFGIYSRAQYLPQPLGSCRNQCKWPSGPADIPPGTPTIFELLPDTDSKRTKKTTSCERLLSVWKFEIGMMCVIWILSFYLLFANWFWTRAVLGVTIPLAINVCFSFLTTKHHPTQ